MSNVAIIYFCTGDYTWFWDGFYSSSEENFLPTSKKTYFVFTDRPEEFSQFDEQSNVRVITISNLPWPLPTLMRYYFVREKLHDLDNFDFVIMANANLLFKLPVSEEEFLPRESEGECYTLVDNNPSFGCNPKDFPYERGQGSAAFIVPGEGKYYVRGGMIVGTAEAFERLCADMDRMVFIDLAARRIAVWHDESYLNRFALGRDDIRILPQEKYLSGSEENPDVSIHTLYKNVRIDLDKVKSLKAVE